MLKVDEINSKILKDLLKNCRKSFSDIAKESKSSEEVISKRYKQMKNTGIIVGATVQMNYPLLGYQVTGNLRISIEPSQTENAIRLIEKIPNVYRATPTYRRHNVNVVVKLRSLNELEQVKEVLRRQLSVTELKTYLWLGVKNIPENLQISPIYEASKATVDTGQTTENKTLKIDLIDMQIIEKLAKNGRLPFKKIAEELGTSTDTITRRYEKLKNNNVIKPVIQVDPIKIGYCASAAFNIVLISQSSTAEIIEKLCKIPDVYHIVKTSGDYDLNVMACTKSMEHFLSIQDEITKLPNTKIADTEIRPMFHIWPFAKTHISTFN